MAVNRRRLLTAVAGVVGGLAGCGGRTPNREQSTITETPTTPVHSTRTTSTEQSTTSTTRTTEPTQTPTQPTTTKDPQRGSRISYLDGFAHVDWLTDDADVYRVREPTRSALAAPLEASGPRVVVFETSGTIDLEEERLRVDDDRCWIAGQTAPSPGVTLIRGGLRIVADDCVVQHLRIRPGDAGNESDWEPDGIRTGDGTTNTIIDHCNIFWGIDENVSPGYDAINTTISNCLVAEALENASHHKGPHSMGSLVGDRSVGNALIGNVFAHNKRRNPRLKIDTKSVVANNLFYHFVSGTAMGPRGTAAVVGNVYRRPKADFNIVGGKQDGEVPDLLHANNAGDVRVSMTNGQFSVLEDRPFWPGGLEPIGVQTVPDHHHRYVGARPLDRRPHDRRVLDQVANRTGEFLDSQSSVGGYESVDVRKRELAVPDRDIQAWLEEWSLAVQDSQVDPPL